MVYLHTNTPLYTNSLHSVHITKIPKIPCAHDLCIARLLPISVSMHRDVEMPFIHDNNYVENLIQHLRVPE